MTENLDRFEPRWPYPPPGDTILDILEEKNLTLEEFTHHMSYTAKQVNRLIRGETAITGNTALLLDRVLGGNAEFWLSREANYRKAKTRSEESQNSRNKSV